MFTWIGPGRLLMDYGPIQAVITAFRYEEPLGIELQDACQYASDQLKELAACLSIAKLPPGEIKEKKLLPDILLKMIDAVKICGDQTLTSMAAVAGTFADVVADFLVAKGATKVIVNNGGDIAIRMSEGESTRVGIVSDLAVGTYSHVMELTAADGIGGIATSGIGGRSFTKGIASAAVAFGPNCRMADASATLIGNHTFSPDPAIKLAPAEELDPDTDIKGHLVTVSIGELNRETAEKALANGVRKAQELMGLNIIQGAAVFICPHMAVVPNHLRVKILPHNKNN